MRFEVEKCSTLLTQKSLPCEAIKAVKCTATMAKSKFTTTVAV